MTQKRPQKTKS
uniref:Uncharacterized protein n=1 Tax=Anguilla anguilla TaxID=7936 RepID=A0A0E9VCC4_ANGAN